MHSASKRNTILQNNAKSRAKTQTRIPLDFKNEFADKITQHCKSTNIPRNTWIKQAIADKYFIETGRQLFDEETK